MSRLGRLPTISLVCLWTTLSLSGLAIDMSATAQTLDPATTRPAEGIRQSPPSVVALQNARVVIAPGNRLEDATVLIDGDTIVAVAETVDLPPGVHSIDMKGRSIYPGFVNAAGVTADGTVSAAGSDRHWNRYITPDHAPEIVAPGREPVNSAGELRKQGITVQLVAPDAGIISGWSHAVLTGAPDSRSPLLRERIAQHARLTIPPNASGSSFPRSPMGATALLRQTFLDAAWYDQANQAHQADNRIPAPESNTALATIASSVRAGLFILDCPNERFIGRADSLAREFSLTAALRGSGREYRLLESAVAAGRVILLPVAFPDAPAVATTEDADEVSLTELLHWRLAPENPGRLARSGVRIALTTDRLSKPGDFLKSVRLATRRGLDLDTALAALTTVPAEVLGIDDRVGTLSGGKLANLVVTDGDLFDDATQVTETWVAGRRYRHQTEATASDPPERLAGSWAVRLSPGRDSVNELTLTLRGQPDRKSGGTKWSGDISTTAGSAATGAGDEKMDDTDKASAENKTSKAKLNDLIVQSDRINATFDTAALDLGLPSGIARLTVLVVVSGSDQRAAIQPQQLSGELVWADGQRTRLRFGARTVATDEPDKDQPQDKEDQRLTDSDSGLPVSRPLGAVGVVSTPDQPEAVLFRGGTVWTVSAQGKLDDADVLVRDGKIVAVGQQLEPPPGCQIIDCTGLHLSPGIIDCHSHIATDGGVNEASRAVTADVRIGDFIDHSDVTIYRQLAGGVTTANILHGSANPIGGQNQVIKLRWGASPEGLRFADAPPGIKFALGENVKRDTWRDGSTSRYPQSRMGVEQLLRDRFIAAREYDQKWRDWRNGRRTGLPPRRDLRLEALAEVLRGERWVHCHSYRQDEIAALLAVLAEFNVQIGTLQHILEGYKVAEVLAEHRAMASTFADWWAYKFEVFDAIPHNAAILSGRDIVVSMNSDDRELGRHLNTEAAKAVKYGGVDELSALAMVTLNPAKQLRLDHRVGSIEPGKDADLVLWSGRPLSTLSRCEQTWIDGRRYFSRPHDAERRAEDSRLKAELIQWVLSDGEPANDRPKSGSSDKAEQELNDSTRMTTAPRIAEEDRWPREDIYCAARYGHLPPSFWPTDPVDRETANEASESEQ